MAKVKWKLFLSRNYEQVFLCVVKWIQSQRKFIFRILWLVSWVLTNWVVYTKFINFIVDFLKIAFLKGFILLRFEKRYLNFKVRLNYELYRRYNLLFDATTSSFILSLLCSIFVYWHRKFMTYPRDIFAESISAIQTKVVTLELLTYVLFILI